MVNQTRALERSLQSGNEGTLSNFCILFARILVGLIFLQSGWSKLLNYDANVHSWTLLSTPRQGRFEFGMTGF